MKVRFAIGPHGGSLSGEALLGFVDAIEANGFLGTGSGCRISRLRRC